MLTCAIPNIENYTQEVINNNLVLTPKTCNITEDQMNKTAFSKSAILYSLITTSDDKYVSNKGTYYQLLQDVWMSMPLSAIIQHTTFDIKLTKESGHQGYWWNDDLHFSVRLKNANDTIKELVNMVKISNYRMKLTIQLKNNTILKFNL